MRSPGSLPTAHSDLSRSMLASRNNKCDSPLLRLNPCREARHHLSAEGVGSLPARLASFDSELRHRQPRTVSEKIQEVAFPRHANRGSMKHATGMERITTRQTQTVARTRVKSSIRSSVASSPTDSRINPSPIPARQRSSDVIPECEVVAGRLIRLSTPPRLGAEIGN